MKNALVSIIVRTRNESFWIGKCLHEIHNQLYKNFEVIVVDNSSSDKTI
jgi:glycosyltransferase involved in cell wall biosynthesis